mgnify:CR=1 FL=1
MEIARGTDLPDLLTSLGYTVTRVGHYHSTKEMDSLRIKNRRTWYRYSDQTGGDAITFLQHFCGRSFPQAVEDLLAENATHGRICLGFTPDEEIGEGADLFDIPGFGADFAYTVDGGDAGDIEYENFNAAAATVTIHGFSVHPGSAKDTMINASNVAMEFHGALPVMARPETTEGRQGFYHLCQMYGDVTTAKLGYILRDHDAAKLQFKKDNMQDIADYLNGKYGAGTVEVEIKDSYRNMLEKIKPHFHLIETARKAVRMAGLEPVEVPVRGGTDGATLSWMGLPCPNLGTGGFNFHGVCECTTVERMDRCTEIVLNIISLYAE